MILVVLFFLIQALFSIVLGMSAVVLNDGAAVRVHGFFQGYNRITWTVICLQVKQRGNIQKPKTLNGIEKFLKS